jgi:hypothetical protein
LSLAPEAGANTPPLGNVRTPLLMQYWKKKIARTKITNRMEMVDAASMPLTAMSGAAGAETAGATSCADDESMAAVSW